jgi:dihydropteroate synthase
MAVSGGGPGTGDGAAAAWQCGRFRLSLERTRVMGVLNVTPDSFSDGGRYATLESALDHARAMIEQGADIVDIGAESTRPGAAAVPAQVQLERVLPVLRALQGVQVPLSVDTSEPLVMRAALHAGASIINDVRALRVAGALDAVAGSDCGIVLMHMRGEPQDMQQHAVYGDVAAEVGEWLGQQRDRVCRAGVAAQRIVLDPGFGFAKNHAQNRRLLAQLHRLNALGRPLLAGLSRKSMLGEITRRPPAQRLAGSIAAMLLAVEQGARIVRVHDVGEARDALAVWEAIRAEARPASNGEEAS